MARTVRLRDVQEADLPTFCEHQLDPVGYEMAAFTPREEPAFMEHWAKILADGDVIKKTVLFDGQIAGNIVIFERSGKREVGYWIGREFWGKGIATAALSQLLPDVTHRPLYGVVAKHNIGSIRVLEKCGFAIVGEHRETPEGGGPAIEDFIMRLGADE